MTVSQDDLRAAVGAGTITEAQAASILSLSQQRANMRAGRAPQDEPFELFRGFNEIFIVVGLTILFAGYTALGEGFTQYGTGGGATGILYSLIGLVLTVALTGYFTLKRRMVAPSILLSLGIGFFAMRAGLVFDGAFDSEFLIAPAAVVLALSVFWFWARIPFTLLLIVMSTLALCYSAASGLSQNRMSFEDLFLLSNGGILPFITLALGLISLSIALRFDLKDRYRVTRNTANAFWLHVAAAPMIMNPIAATLFSQDAVLGNLLLLGFVLVMAVLAIVIDRRSFLLSGIGYLIALIATVLDGGWAVAVLLLGLLLVTLGAQWERIRCAILNALPGFPGKANLPPWSSPDGSFSDG
jgi:hypothetical protein